MPGIHFIDFKTNKEKQPNGKIANVNYWMSDKFLIKQIEDTTNVEITFTTMVSKPLMEQFMSAFIMKCMSITDPTKIKFNKEGNYKYIVSINEAKPSDIFSCVQKHLKL